MTQLTFTHQDATGARESGRVLVASGSPSRNRDWSTGKPFRLVPSGMRFDAWASQGGTVFWMHNFNIPVGRAELFLDQGKLWANDAIQFHRRVMPVATQNWIGDAIGEVDTSVIADLWEEGFINSVSIHIMLTPDDEQLIVEGDEEILIPQSEVIEFSIVTVPGDRDAVRQQMERMGVSDVLAECLTCSTTGSGLSVARLGADNRNSVEVAMPQEQEVIEEEVQETEPVAEVEEEVIEEEVIEEELEILPEEIAESLASSPQAIEILARAFAAHAGALEMFFEAVQPLLAASAPPQRVRLVKRKAAEPARMENAQSQPRVQRVKKAVKEEETQDAPALKQRANGKPSGAELLTRMVRPGI